MIGDGGDLTLLLYDTVYSKKALLYTLQKNVKVICRFFILQILPINGDGEEAVYQCPICQEVVSSSHDLTVHIRTHNTHAAAAQSNTCTICGKILSSQSSLDRHMLVHSGKYIDSQTFLNDQLY